MGIFDNNIEMTYVDGIQELDVFYNTLNEKLGSKYKIKHIKKGNIGKQMLSGVGEDQILISKNAYHRTIVTIAKLPQQLGQENDETVIHFDRETADWWVSMVVRATGMIGSGALKIIYGSNKTFDNDILDALKSKHELKTRKYNAGISSLWKKDNQN